MSTTFFVILIILFLLNPPLLLMSRVAAATSRPLGSNPPNYVSLKPTRSHGGFAKQVVDACLPKGFRHSSAPSRYINYQPLGSTICSPAKHVAKPWSAENEFWTIYHCFVIIRIIRKLVSFFFFYYYSRMIEWRCKSSIDHLSLYVCIVNVQI